MIKLVNIKKEYEDRVIFHDINLEIQSHERLGIIGNNGSGKTTLISIISGVLDVTGGKVILSPDTIISLMPQVNYREDESFLSGGERTKKAILRAFSKYSNLLILDEPTNHLDFKGIKWLKGLIDNYSGIVIIVSHDRYFMDLVCNRIYELDNGSGTMYKGNYTDYKKEKDHRFQTQLNAYYKQEEIRKSISDDIENLKGWSKKAHEQSRKKARESGNKFGGKEYLRVKAKKKDAAIKSRIKRLEKIQVEGVDKPEEPLEIKFKFQGTHNKVNKIFYTEDLAMGFDEVILFESDNIVCRKGERIGFLGLNGTGKSTFVKLLLGKLEPVKGVIYMNCGIDVGYLSQEVLDLDPEQSVLESLGFYTKDKLTIARTQLNNLGISKELVYKKIKTLSMGERTRVKFAKLILEENDVLILDEPTNHLDIVTRETLEKALSCYEGTLIIISHDYYMLKQLCKDTIIIEDGWLRKLSMSPGEWIERNELSRADF